MWRKNKKLSLQSLSREIPLADIAALSLESARACSALRVREGTTGLISFTLTRPTGFFVGSLTVADGGLEARRVFGFCRGSFTLTLFLMVVVVGAAAGLTDTLTLEDVVEGVRIFLDTEGRVCLAGGWGWGAGGSCSAKGSPEPSICRSLLMVSVVSGVNFASSVGGTMDFWIFAVGVTTFRELRVEEEEEKEEATGVFEASTLGRVTEAEETAGLLFDAEVPPSVFWDLTE